MLVVAALAALFLAAFSVTMLSPLVAVASDDVEDNDIAAMVVGIGDGDSDSSDEAGGAEGTEGESGDGSSGGEGRSGAKQPSAEEPEKTFNAWFFVSVYDGASLPSDYRDLSTDSSNYSSGIWVEGALSKYCHSNDYHPEGLGSDVLLRLPSIGDIANACSEKGIPFDPSKHEIIWYIAKQQQDGWHVDGAIIQKPGGTDPVDPEDPVDPVDPADPVDPVDPADPVDPVDPVTPVAPVEPVIPDADDDPAPTADDDDSADADDADEAVDEPMEEPADEPVDEPEQKTVDIAGVKVNEADIESAISASQTAFVYAVGACGVFGMGLATVGLVVVLAHNISSLRRLRSLAEKALQVRRPW